MDLSFLLPLPSLSKHIRPSILFCQVAAKTISSWLDGKHVVFGEVLEGYDVVEKIQDVPKDGGSKPTKPVKIVKSGELEEGTHPEL